MKFIVPPAHTDAETARAEAAIIIILNFCVSNPSEFAEVSPPAIKSSFPLEINKIEIDIIAGIIISITSCQDFPLKLPKIHV